MDWVIDCDAHVTEPGDVWTSRLPKRMLDRAPRIVRNEKTGWDVWQIGDGQAFLPVGHTAVAGWKEPFPAAPSCFEEVPPAAHDPAKRLEYLDSIGVWAQVQYPNVGGFGNQGFLKLGDPELQLECVRAYNDFLIDWCSTDARRLIPIMATPFWDVKAAVGEIERCAKKGHKGVLFSGAPQDLDMPFLGDRHWDPIWTAAQEADLPISFHIGGANFDANFSPERFRAHGVGATIASSTTMLFLENAKQLVDLLLCGVLPRFPRLRFVSVESGIGFIPFVLEAVDYTFEYSGVTRDRPEFEMRPSEYFKRQVYSCYFFEEIAPKLFIDAIGADNVLFETDYPHPVCLYGNVREKIEAGLAGQKPEIRHKLLWQNAADLYRVAEPDRTAPDAR